MTCKEFIILGAGGHAKSVKEVLLANQLKVIGFLDDFLSHKDIIGKISDFPKYRNSSFAIGIGFIDNPSIRLEIIKKCSQNQLDTPNIFSLNSYCSSNSKYGIGNIFHHFSFVNFGVEIGNFGIFNTRCVVEHEVKIGDNVHISTGAIINGNVQIGDNVFVGSGALIKQGVEICSGAIIGMGSVVTHSITETGTYAGNPAKRIR